MRPRTRLNYWSFFHWLEKKVIRVLILGAVFLTVVQLGFGLVRDPVDFYLAVTRQVESPPLEAVNAQEYYKVALASNSPGPITVIQNGQVIGRIAGDVQEFYVRPGSILLDGRHLEQMVTVSVVGVEPQLTEPVVSQTFIVDRNVQEILIRP